MSNKATQCVRCTVSRCRTHEHQRKVPGFCPTERYTDLVKESIERNKLPENRAINLAWRKLMDKVLYQGKPLDRYTWTRLDEIMEYARIRGMKKIGIAYCYAVETEARLLSGVLERNNFEVVSIACLSGEIDPKEVDMEGNVFCNPILQAEVLNRENTELNLMVGLCIGHDIIFLRNCRAETTPFLVKDRATGHNPAVALYMSQGYYKDRFTAQR